MPQKRKSEQSQQGSKSEKKQQAAVHAAALALAAQHGWVDISVAEIYAKAGVSLPSGIGKTVWPIVADILASLDAAVLADVHDRLGGRWRDDMFELLMTRFDLMQAQRDAYSDIMPAALTRSCHAGPVLTRRLTQAMHAMIDQANVPVDGLRRHAAVVALAGIYLSLLEVWRQDDSADLSKTMAAVDQRLNWFENILSSLSGRQTDDHA